MPSITNLELSIFGELTAILIGAGVIAYLVHFLKQPSIIAYIIAGLIIGPLGFYQLAHGEIVHGLSEIGITLLLFMVGLDLDISQLKKIGKAAVLAGLGQVIFTAGIGFALIKLLGFETVPALYMALALTFSSTIIVVKLLSEKKDMQSLYGKLAIGIFLIQDIAAILILIFLAGINNTHQSTLAGDTFLTSVILTLGKAFLIGLIVVALSRTVFPRLLKSLVKSDELLLLFSLAWSLGLAALFSSPLVGFNAAIGGFVAGLALANTGAHFQVSGRIKPIRDFFIVIFFIFLGSQLVISDLSSAILPALSLAAFVLIGNPLIVTIILGLLGYKLRTSFLAGVTVAQISEFSLILMALGLASGHVSQNHVTIVTLVGIATIGISSYGILYSNKVYEKLLGRVVKYFDHGKKTDEGLGDAVFKNHIIVVGAHRLGSHIIHGLKKHKENFIVIDFNPDITDHYSDQKIPAICGDITDPYMQEVTAMFDARMIISTIPDFNDTRALLESLRVNKPKHRIKVIVAASDEAEALELYDLGADYVLLPHFIGGMHLADIIQANHSISGLNKLKKRQMKTLNNSLRTS